MEDDRFDDWTRAVAGVSRRRVLRGLAGAAFGGLLARLGPPGATAQAATAVRCRREKKECRRDSQCCSGVCKRGRCRRAPTQSTCTIRKNFCRTGSDGSGCGTTNGGDPCACFVTAGGASFCGDVANADCLRCASDADCVAATGPGSACVRGLSAFCATCDDTGGTRCLPPCVPDPVAAA